MTSSFLKLILSIPHIQTLLAALVAVGIVEVCLYGYRRSIIASYKSKKSGILSSEEAEQESLRYFSKLHILSVIRMIYFFILLLVLIALYDIRAFSFFAFALGAFIIALRDVLISLLAYPHIIISYDIGDDVCIAGVLGEIVRVRPLSTQLAGKDDKGDYNGKLQIIPNSKFLLEMIERQEIKNGNQRMVTVSAMYNSEEQSKRFAEWLQDLKAMLDQTLTKRSLKEVGNFKSYAGLRYKLHYEYDKHGLVLVKVSFISRLRGAQEKKEAIVMYLESVKAPKETSDK